MSFSLEKKVADCLKQHPEQKKTAREIANWIVETYPEECRKKQERSTAIRAFQKAHTDISMS